MNVKFSQLVLSWEVSIHSSNFRFSGKLLLRNQPWKPCYTKLSNSKSENVSVWFGVNHTYQQLNVFAGCSLVSTKWLVCPFNYIHLEIIAIPCNLIGSHQIYSQIAPFFALNDIFSSANEKASLKLKNQTHFNAFSRYHSNCRKMKYNFNNILQTNSVLDQ